MKKTILAIFMAVLMLLSAACQGEQPGSTADAAASTQQTQQTQQTQPDATWMTLPDDYTMKAAQYFVYSCETGEFLTISEDSGSRIYPASVTKLFTAYVALQYLDARDTVTAGEVLNMVAAGSSVAEIKQGDSLTVEALVEGMLLPSGNDAAYILAAAAGKAMYGEKADEASTADAVKRFVEEMNAQAATLGMKGTHFANPDGIHSDDHYTTYADLAIMGTLAVGDPIIMKYAAVAKAEVSAQSGTLSWHNTNALIDSESQYYCPYAAGLKTGQTPYAGSCLLSAFEYRGQTLIIGVFGCPEVDDRFPDTLHLFSQSVKNFQ